MPPLIAAGHFRNGVTELFLDVAFVNLARLLLGILREDGSGHSPGEFA